MTEAEQDVVDHFYIDRARNDTSPKTAESIQKLYEEFCTLSDAGTIRLGFHTFANISWLEFTGWSETGIWPPPEKVEVCICCEKKLEPVSYSSVCQPYGGGEVRVCFNFGSRFDHLGSRLPVYGDPYHDFDLGDGKDPISVGTIIGSKPRQESLDSENRTERLSACSHVLGTICDDCFEKKSHLFKGYEINNKQKLDLLVK